MRTKLRIIVTVNCMNFRVITPGGDADLLLMWSSQCNFTLNLNRSNQRWFPPKYIENTF